MLFLAIAMMMIIYKGDLTMRLKFFCEIFNSPPTDKSEDDSVKDNKIFNRCHRAIRDMIIRKDNKINEQEYPYGYTRYNTTKFKFKQEHFLIPHQLPFLLIALNIAQIQKEFNKN
ncbi:hypothetical protein BKH42_08450 [Helicobacter sp. 13S00482-2]|nr:hypothetical protein BKH42_08450 [Helicobacter sp. 13S00482-2]